MKIKEVVICLFIFARVFDFVFCVDSNSNIFVEQSDSSSDVWIPADAPVESEQKVQSVEEIFVDSEIEKDEDESKVYMGWTITKVNINKNKNKYEISSETGMKAFVTVKEEFSQQSLIYIGRALDAILQIPGLVIKEIFVYVDSPCSFNFVVIPSSFMQYETELKEYLPAGLSFSYSGSLRYDIDILIDDFSFVLRGIFISEEDFAASVYKAVSIPELYIKENDLSERVSRLEDALLALSSKGFYSHASKMNQGLIQFVKNMYNENSNITKKDVIAELKKQKIKYTASEVDTIFAVLLGVYEK